MHYYYFSEEAKLVIRSVVETIYSQEPTEKKILLALEYMCQHFQYERGFIYHADSNRVFHLHETHARLNKTLLRPTFKIGELSSIQLAYMTKPELFYCCGDCGNKETQEVLKFWNVNSLLIIPFADNKDKIIGFLGLANKTKKECLTDGEVEVIQVLLRMISREILIHEYQNREKLARKTMENIMDNMGIDIYVNEFDSHDMLYANKSMTAPYGGYEQFEGKKCWQALYKDKTGECEFCPRPKLIDEDGKPSRVYSWDYLRPFDNSWFRVFSVAFEWIDGRMAHVVSSVDITENKRNEAIIKEMAERDPLTGLPNRRKLVEDFEEKLNHKVQDIKEGYVMFLDLDGFKKVNDTLGHKSGDELLIQVAVFFESLPGTEGNVYRQSGDEFVILLSGEKREQIVKISNEIMKRFDNPWILTQGEASCHVSIGIAHFPSDGDNAEDLLQVADAAMYAVKRSGKRGVRFTHEDNNVI